MRAAAIISATSIAASLTLAALSTPASAQFYSKDIHHLNQNDPRGFDPATSTGDNNCAPTAMIQCLEWWARHLVPGLVPNATEAEIYNAVKEIAKQGGIGKDGMGWDKIQKALEEWLKKHDPQHKLKVKGHDHNVTRGAVFNEFIPGATGMGQDVIWLGESTTMTTDKKDVMASHAMTMEWVDQSDTPPVRGDNDGRFVGMADPATGAKATFVMAPDGSLYDPTGQKQLWRPKGFFTVCPAV
jgi:hypothetical protein